MLSTIYSCTVTGIDGFLVEVEVDVSRGIPQFSTVGLPDSAIKESKDRVRAAIKNSGYDFPAKRITVNLAPADLRKEGAGFDLPIAIALLCSFGILAVPDGKSYCIVGELGLDGGVREIRGILSMVLTARDAGFERVIIPQDNIVETALVSSGIEIVPVENLRQVVELLTGEAVPQIQTTLPDEIISCENEVDFSEIKGQHNARRGMEIAAAGSHNILLSGPPGAGKTMLARRMSTILPQLGNEELLETSKIRSVSNKITRDEKFSRQRPFRSPHHTISDAGLIGGGHIPQPGEVSLAHNGVLFLDELPEFKRNVLEVMRQPLEDGEVTIARANMTLTFPSRFLLVAAMNPCPCGFLGDSRNKCSCSEHDIQRYTAKISGPLLDRIDLKIETSALSFTELRGDTVGEGSATIRNRVETARTIQACRFAKYSGVFCNAQMSSSLIEKFCKIDNASAALLERGMDQLGLSARAYHKILKVARTIADLATSEHIAMSHIAEAISLGRIRI